MKNMKNKLSIFLCVFLSTIMILPTSCKKKEEVVHPYAIGQHFRGGIIFYIDASWQHGLICASSDQGPSRWGCDLKLMGGTSTAIGTGNANTAIIINIYGASADAAYLCDQYSVTVEGVTYDDWFLPSIDELTQLYKQNILIHNYNYGFWSSSEYDAFNMRGTSNSSGEIEVCSKDYGVSHVIPIRAF